MNNAELFEGYTMQDLYKQVVTNTRQNRKQLQGTIATLVAFIKNIVDVQMLSPQIASYMNIIVKNDQMLIKIAAVAAKLNAASSKCVKDEVDDLSEGDKKELMVQASKQMVSILDQLRSQNNVIRKPA